MPEPAQIVPDGPRIGKGNPDERKNTSLVWFRTSSKNLGLIRRSKRTEPAATRSIHAWLYPRWAIRLGVGYRASNRSDDQIVKIDRTATGMYRAPVALTDCDAANWGDFQE